MKQEQSIKAQRKYEKMIHKQGDTITFYEQTK